jgi:ribosomal protein S13
VFRNLLEIKGISTTLALKICALLGISSNTIYSKLSPHKVDQLNLLLSLYRKKTSPFLVTSNVVSHSNVPLNQKEQQKKDYLMLPGIKSANGITKVGQFGGHPESLTGLSPAGKGVAQMGEKILHSPILSSLDEFKKENIKILINLNALRGRRFKQGYPVRGQRTRSNAKTARRLNRMYH